MPSKSSTKKIEEAFEPMIEFNTMLAKTAETAFNMQMESLKAYSELGMENMTAGMKVKTFDEMASYVELQKELAQKASDMMVSDAKHFAELGTKFMDKAKTMAEGSMKTGMATATEAMKAA